MLQTNRVSIELVLTPISHTAAQCTTAGFHSEFSLYCSGSALTISVLSPRSIWFSYSGLQGMNVCMPPGMGSKCTLSVSFSSGCVLRCHLFNMKGDTDLLWPS